MGAEIYTGMSTLDPPTPVIERGMALHKLIRTVTMALGGEAYLTFMGNEFGHPEWLDFPRAGNDWSYHYCRRQWGLVDAPHLRYSQLNAWDAACMAADDEYGFIASSWQWATMVDDGAQVLVAERGPLVFVFNFSPSNDYEGLKVPVPQPGKYRPVLDSDAKEFGGRGRVGHGVDHFSDPVAAGGEKYWTREQYIHVLAPARTVVAYVKVPDEVAKLVAAPAAKAAAGAAPGAGAGKGGAVKAKRAPRAASPSAKK
jgi:1,4-alpha-glucan branching enzyme